MWVGKAHKPLEWFWETFIWLATLYLRKLKKKIIWYQIKITICSFFFNCRATPIIIAVIVVFAIALPVCIAIAIYIIKKSESTNQLKQFDFENNMVCIINHPAHFININVDNLERKARKSKDTSVNKEGQDSLIQKHVDNERGNLSLGTFYL